MLFRSLVLRLVVDGEEVMLGSGREEAGGGGGIEARVVGVDVRGWVNMAQPFPRSCTDVAELLFLCASQASSSSSSEAAATAID